MTAPLEFKRIVVGVDGSEHGCAALEWAIGLAKLTGAEITAVYGLHVPIYSVSGYESTLAYDEKWTQEMQRVFEDEWCAPLRTSGVAFRTVFEEGRPAVLIADVAERQAADLVIVGRRGRSGLAELMLGSVSHELTHQCRRPVLVVERAVVKAKAKTEPKLVVASA